MTKRGFDLAAAGTGLLLLAPLLGIVALLVWLDSGRPVIFKQERVGYRFRRFTIYKFRTMAAAADGTSRPITWGDDPRITKVGKVLRRLKLDELPQLLNVVKGDMSLVGPRPELARYVELFARDYEEILQVRPGITDLASIGYRDEAAVLGSAEDPESEYVTRILPDKIRLAKIYVRKAAPSYDLKLIAATLLILMTRGAWPRLAEVTPPTR